MPQASIHEFERLPLRVHSFLAGVPLRDAWFVDLPRWREGVTLDDFLRTGGNCLCTPSPLVRTLLEKAFGVQTRLHFPSEVGSPLFLQHKRNRGKERRECDNTIRRKRPTPKRGLGLNQDQHDTEYNDADFPPR
jgi:hypothetical protein